MILTLLLLMAAGGEPNASRPLEQHYVERDRDAGPLEDFRGGGSSDSSVEAAATIAVLLGTAVVMLAIWGIAALVKAAAS